MAVLANFGSNTLSVLADNLDNNAEISRNAAGALLVNGGAVAVTGGTPSVANTTLIQAFGQGGDDRITINEANGALPRAMLFGGEGDDVLTGGSGADRLFGGNDNDTLLGKGGVDNLFGGAGNDVLTGGDGDDGLFGEAGDDRMIWNPGDDSDLFEGGSGIDTAETNGGNGAERFTVSANGTRVRLDRVEPAPFALDIGTTESLVVNLNGGDDSFSATGNLAALIKLTVDGGTGNDSILGGNGADTLLGGDGNDFIDGNQGNDIALLGAGNDTFSWNPGDGNDVVEGQDGSDTLAFDGSAGNEIIALSANGGGTLLTRNIANVVLDLNDVETVEVAALGGTDLVTVGDLSGTDVLKVTVDLAGALTANSGDALADSVIVTGTNGSNRVDIASSGTALSVSGLSAGVDVRNAEGANDSLVVNTLGGDDTLDASDVALGVMKLTLDGGAGNDLITGSRGNDVLLAGEGNDTVLGGVGNDLALLGAGNDLFQWAAGDDSDTVEGQAGSDTLAFGGSGAGESIEVTANGERARLTRNVGNVTLHLNELEVVQMKLLGGADSVVVGDLSGTDVKQVVVDLTALAGGGDGQADSVTANGTLAADSIVVDDAGSSVQVGGLAAGVDIQGAEALNDRLVLNGLGGNDVIDASRLDAGRLSLTINGGLGDDVLTGSAGNDSLVGGDGADVALMGAGNDTFSWTPGDDNDVVDGQAGSDTLLFTGSNVSEIVDITATAGRAVLTRNVASVVMDTNDVETIDFKALGGADQVSVRDLSGSDVRQVRIDLAAAGGTGDAQADIVTIEGTQGNDVAVLSLSGGTLIIGGLATQVVITGFEAGSDQLVFKGLGGDDLVDASALPANVMRLLIDGGAGNDILIGGAGADVLVGGDGDDVLIGGPGVDVLDGGAGSNVVIQG